MSGTKTLESWLPSSLEIRRPGTLSSSSKFCGLAMLPNPTLTNHLQGSSRAATSPLWSSLYWRDIESSRRIMAAPPCLTCKSLSHPAHRSHCALCCLPVPVVRWQSSTLEKWGVEATVWHLHPCLAAVWLKKVICSLSLSFLNWGIQDNNSHQGFCSFVLFREERLKQCQTCWNSINIKCSASSFFLPKL